MYRRYNNEVVQAGATAQAGNDAYECKAFRQVLLDVYGREGDELNAILRVTAAEIALAEYVVSFRTAAIRAPSHKFDFQKLCSPSHVHSEKLFKWLIMRHVESALSHMLIAVYVLQTAHQLQERIKSAKSGLARIGRQRQIAVERYRACLEDVRMRTSIFVTPHTAASPV